MSMVNERADAGQSRGIKLTLLAITVFMLVVVGGFVYRIQQPRVTDACVYGPFPYA